MALTGFNALLNCWVRGEVEKDWRLGEGLEGKGGRGEVEGEGGDGAEWLPPLPLPLPFPFPFPFPFPLPALKFGEFRP